MKIKRISAILTAVLFAGILAVLCLLTVLLPKKTVSASERRRLAELPSFSYRALLDGSYFSGLSDYATDHFALRESFRTANTALRTGVFLQREVNGIFEEDGYLYAPVWPLDEKAVLQAAQKMQAVADMYFPGKNVYVSVIPDKADFAGQDCLRIDTGAVAELLLSGFDAQYIDILGTLQREDFYRTDSHWRQECLEETAAALVNGMGGTFSPETFAEHTVSPFYGVLWGRYAMPLPADTLVYCTSAATENAVVRNLDHPDVQTVYDTETESPDKYDLFLSGASSVIEIESPSARTDRHLVLFRDSFGSSLAPWLLTEYEKITMIDMRYIASQKIGEYADLDSADDVLFLYSTAILNTGGILK